jgi:hypothetical protein
MQKHADQLIRDIGLRSTGRLLKGRGGIKFHVFLLLVRKDLRIAAIPKAI